MTVRKSLRFLVSVFLVHSSVAKGFENAHPTGFFPFERSWENLESQDLAPIGEFSRSRTLLGLGEQYHTSGGFYEAKYRLVRYLVEDRSFRYIAFETPWRSTLPATRYVESCEGSSKDAVMSLPAIYQDRTIQAMLEWMCAHNRMHPDAKTSLFGVDIKDFAFDIIETWLNSKIVDANTAQLVRSGLKLCAGYGFESYTKFMDSDFYKGLGEGTTSITDEEHNECVGAMDKIQAMFESSANSEVRVAIEASKRLQIMLFEFASHGMTEAVMARDQGMLETFEKQKRVWAAGAKGILWAHNAHVRKGAEIISRPGKPDVEYRLLGGLLYQRYGSEYGAIAFNAYNMEIDSSIAPIPPGGVPEFAAPGTIESIIFSSWRPRSMFVNFASPWFERGKSYSFYSPDNKIIPVNEFEGLIYLERSPKMEFLR